jgi:hypothetical protein
MTAQPRATDEPQRRARRLDPIAALLFAVGLAMILRVSRLTFLNQDANWDLLNYHAYVPAALFDGHWFSDLHPAGGGSYTTPYQDLVLWPLISILPAPFAEALIIAIQLTVIIPVGLILRLVVPGLSTPRAMAVALIGVSGTMAMTELGSTQGDIPPAILLAWSLYLLLSIMTGASHPERRAALAGLLVGAAVAIKLTTMLVAPGMLAVVAALVLAGHRRSAALFSFVAPISAVVFYAPWGIVLLSQAGSPLFPFYNAIFKAPRFPTYNAVDTRFPVTNPLDLIMLPLRLAEGTAYTSEIPFRDMRWLLAFAAAALGVSVAAVRGLRGRALDGWRDHLPRLTLLVFWSISFVVWAWYFGIQRYAMVLEVLALPVMCIGACLALPRLPKPASLLALLVIAALLGATTTVVNFGRRPMTWSPLFPTETIEPLDRYDAVVVGSPPLAYLAAVTRNSPGASDRVWIGPPFDPADLAVGQEILRGRSVGVVFYPNARDQAEGAANSLGLTLTQGCQSFVNPLSSEFIGATAEVCAAVPSP